jgi:hypothetical protein
LTALLDLPGTTALWGQETEYRVGEDGRFVQLISWDEEENALYYEVEIEKQTEELWESVLTGKTEALFFESSLEAGTYRYRVRSYDFLERPGPVSDWIQFVILPARQPALLQFSPDRFFLDEEHAWVITISGDKFVEGLDAFLKGPRGELIKPETVRVEPSRNEARLIFSYEQLSPGIYTICVTNPGGLTSELQPFIIMFRRVVDINVSAGYRPLIPFYGYINELFGMTVFPVGAYSRLSIVPMRQGRGYIGIELEPSWNYIMVTGDNYEAQAQMPGATIYGMCRIWFANQVIALNVRIGGGIYSFLDYHFTFDRGSTDSITALLPAVVAGVSSQWFVKKPFFIEAGLDFSHFFTADDPSPGYLRPFAGLGWQF